MIYFIECDGLVKIGYTKRPRARLSGIQSHNPHELIMRLLIEGTLDDEIKYHELFKSDLHRGEWFFMSEEIKEFIEKNQKIDLRYDMGLLNNYNELKAETARIRNMLGLCLREVGEKIGITAQSVKEIETRELMGTVSIKVLSKYASSLGFRLSYEFVKPDTIIDAEKCNIDVV